MKLVGGIEMSWEWSHTQEAYDNAKANLEALSLADLRTIWAEWLTYAPGHGLSDSDGCIEELFPAANKAADSYNHEDELVECIWKRAEEFRTCDNGGFNAYVCPYGCHTVSFDRAEDSE